ncbi:unnamed protein product [Brachionus calyciflorus]|uniref:G-protein coupled receptors family 2 profile 1 domain-containing protein n=1 Tax=Brachionus calyciflorus TaxID=104777 RepID=A0A814E0V5_9BILA|nr:unnamed protein product [Brachionus calyciflorus]
MTNECPKAFAFNIWWPRTNFNQVANSSCPKGSTGVSYRLCTINGWASNLDLTENTDQVYALWTDLIIILKKYMIVLVENGQDYTLNDEINLNFNNIQFGLRTKNQVSYSNLNFKLDFTAEVKNKLVYTSLNLTSYNLPKHLMLNSRQGSISTYRVVIILNPDFIINNKSSRITIEFLLTNNFDVQ